ncbi:flagellar basal body protein FliL [Marinomonas agarivorans]|nr:flagellar basal body protein FliL [Marinomonas agarivorans]
MLLIVIQKQVLRSALLCFVLFGSIAALAEDDRRENLPIYIELQPAFVINYIGYTDKLRYLKTKITLRAADLSGDTIVEENMPLVRDALVMYLSARNVDEVTGAAAREELRKTSIDILNETLKEETGQAPIIDVLFTSFVTQ